MSRAVPPEAEISQETGVRLEGPLVWLVPVQWLGSKCSCRGRAAASLNHHLDPLPCPWSYLEFPRPDQEL